NQMQRLGCDALQLAPAHQRLLAAMRHPDFAGSRFPYGFQKLVPVRMIGDDQRQLYPALFGALADPHPARREAGNRVGEAPGPAVGESRWWADDDRASEIALRAAFDCRGS